jgi:hypothetical protein
VANLPDFTHVEAQPHPAGDDREARPAEEDRGQAGERARAGEARRRARERSRERSGSGGAHRSRRAKKPHLLPRKRRQRPMMVNRGRGTAVDPATRWSRRRYPRNKRVLRRRPTERAARDSTAATAARSPPRSGFARHRYLRGRTPDVRGRMVAEPAREPVQFTPTPKWRTAEAIPHNAH